MTTPRQSPELDAEREVDLARWRRALARLWWLPVAGLVLGAIVGVLYSFRGTTNYQASALISLGQPTSPGGALVNGFGQNPRAISLIVSSASAQAQAADRADMRPGALRGHVSVAQVGTTTGAGATRSTPLISLTVTGAHPANVAAAANALAGIVVQKTTAAYVLEKIKTFNSTLQSVDRQLTAIQRELTTVSAALAASTKLDPLQRLVIVSQEDNAETRQGNLIAQQNTLQQQLAFAKNVESASVITQARAVKASAHSRGTSLVIGAIIGLILGAIAAIVADGRRRATA
jgi:Skp family chaperone for outer membrane proteins